ncbi:glycosyltransferase family protein [Desulfofundulus sp.]|uniref:glycosyltransferase family protein n=1 Tax=Desulfofundulus sp. TaxID=2282750 RepID=UPI003C791CD0
MEHFAFIICSQDDARYRRCLQYLQALERPGVQVEFFRVVSRRGIAAAYNRAMERSTATCKVYLHDDVFILNRRFCLDVLEIFRADPSIGLIGVCGCKEIPPSGVWWEGDTYGKVYHGDPPRLLHFKQPASLYEPVEAVDGLLMVTRFDLPWRDDIIDGFHFYDLSHCLEFNRRGYRVVVPRQEEPWCYHRSTGRFDTEYERLRQVFLREYAGELSANRWDTDGQRAVY